MSEDGFTDYGVLLKSLFRPPLRICCRVLCLTKKIHKCGVDSYFTGVFSTDHRREERRYRTNFPVNPHRDDVTSGSHEQTAPPGAEIRVPRGGREEHRREDQQPGRPARSGMSPGWALGVVWKLAQQSHVPGVCLKLRLEARWSAKVALAKR